MNKGIKVLIIVVLSLIVISASMYIISLLFGSNRFSFLKKLKVSSNLTVLDEVVLDEEFISFNDVSVKVNAGNVNIINTDSDKTRVVIYGTGNKNKAYIDNNTLQVEAKVRNCKFFCYNRKIAKIDIYLPNIFSGMINIDSELGDIFVDNYSNSNISVNLSAGDIKINDAKNVNLNNHFGDIKVNGYVKVLTVNADCGNIRVSSCNVCNVVNHLGDIEIDKISERAEINDDCGDIEIDKLYLVEDSNINNNMGDIEIRETNNINIKAKTTLGENSVNNSNSNSNVTVKITNSLGDIKVNY